MLSNLFLGMSLLGAEWVLYLLVLLSILSVTIIFERIRFYRDASQGIREFRDALRQATVAGQLGEAARRASERSKQIGSGSPDLESEMAAALFAHYEALKASNERPSAEVLDQLARDAVIRARIRWDRNLSILATIGSNAPFVGLFGTVLGIIKAFHDLSHQGGAGAQTVTSGISEALVATAIGLLVAIPAVIAFNLFQRKVKAAQAEAEALKSFLIGKLAD